MIGRLKKIPFSSIIFITVIWFFSVLPAFAADETIPQDFVSICDRTEKVRIAIQQEVAFLRFTSGIQREVRCHAISASELKNIGYLQIIEKEVSSLKPGDFAGLDSLKTLDLEGNKLSHLDSSTLLDLTALENLILAGNFLSSLGHELSALPNLKRVDFSGCKLSSISPGAFSGNQKLEAVFLSDNKLKELPEGIFRQNPALQVVDLAGNQLQQLPSAFFPENGALQSLDVSQNRIENLDKVQFPKLPGLRVINLSNNPVEYSDHQGAFLKIFDPSVEVITSQSHPAKRKEGDTRDPDSFIPDSENHVSKGIQRIRGFVRNHWHLPIEIKISFSSRGQMDLKNPGLRAREERLLLRQLEEVREAYRRAAFDFFEVNISFAAPDSLQKAPALGFDKEHIGLLILLKTGWGESDDSSLVSDDQILELLADNFSRSRSIAWFKKEDPENLKAALKRDFEKVARIDDELRFDIIRLDDLIDTVLERMKNADEKNFFSNSELVDARFIEFRVMLAFQRLENTLARWRMAENDSGFPYRPEARLLLSEASEVYRTYLDWFLNTVVGGRATINVLNTTWYHRNSIFKILDAEVPAGFFNVEGRISSRIPGGAIRDLLKSRLSLPLLHFLHGMRFLDEKVSDIDVQKSPLSSQMIQAMDRIRRDRQSLELHQISYTRALKELWDARIKNSVKFPLYHVTAGVATWIGDTRLSNPAPAITDEQIEDMKSRLKPGDILIERTDYFLSNAFLGGFWPHGILYLGPKEEWSKMKLPDGTTLAEDPWIAEHILQNYRSEKDNRPALVMEAISEGVVFNSLEEAAQKDYIAVFRPKFSPGEQEAKIAGIIRRALKYHGRPYDFDFDFFTDDKLVCTELLYRAYHPDINFLIQKEAIRKPDPPVPGMIRKAGRDTMPAGEVVKLALYMLDHREPDPSIGYAGQNLEFVRLYMKQGKGMPAKIFEGEQGIEALKRSLK